MAQDEHRTSTINTTWSRTASLLASEASNSEAIASRQALRRLFGPWEQQLLGAPNPRQAQQRPLGTLLCLRELLTRFYQVRYEFDQSSPPPEKLPITIPDQPDFDSLCNDDKDFCIDLVSPLPERWLKQARQKFIVLERHCQELEPLLQRYFNQQEIREAIAAQDEGLQAIAKNLGYDSAVKAFKDDALRKTLAPLAANKTLDADTFRGMLKQQRKNYDHLTINGEGQSFSVDGCSFRHTHFHHTTLELESCALHHTRFGKGSYIRFAYNCEFGKQAESLRIDTLKGDYAGTHFNKVKIKIVYPGCQLGHLSNSHVDEFGGNVKYLDNCRVQTLRGICLKVDNSFVERAIRARFGTKIAALRCVEMTDCQFGQRVIEGVKSVKRLQGETYSDLTFVNTAFDTIAEGSVVFRLRSCLVKNLQGTIATLEGCRALEIQAPASINKVIRSQIELIKGGTLKLCGILEEAAEQDSGKVSSKRQRTRVGKMTGGTIDHLNGFIQHLQGGKIQRLGFEEGLRLSKAKTFLGDWRSGSIGNLSKTEFLTREKDLLRQETRQIANAIQQQAANTRDHHNAKQRPPPPAARTGATKS